jgi:hypothetical protein
LSIALVARVGPTTPTRDCLETDRVSGSSQTRSVGQQRRDHTGCNEFMRETFRRAREGATTRPGFRAWQNCLETVPGLSEEEYGREYERLEELSSELFERRTALAKQLKG